MLKSVSMDKNYDGITLLTRSYMCMGHILNHSKDRQNNMDGLWDLQNTHTRTHAYTHASSGYQKKVRSAVNYTSMKAMVITITNIIRLINTKRRKVITRVIIWYCLLMSFPPKKSHRACYITGQCGTSLKQNKRNLKKPNP